ncbi:SGNH/GDSL hydrolase family protein [Streptomyces sp. NPDC048636]|uniref:SGNH/GDSL hydrolase family protein n=1 Tax=Streptomyces sp. NPDC048636 TaxID=3155762 RepID=UPI00341B8865
MAICRGVTRQVSAPAVVGVPPQGVPGEAPPGAVRFAALGDSLTEGLGDPAAGGGWRGWAALLAESAGPRGGAEVELVNVSRSGALAADVAEEQLTAARRARPHLASVVVGGNDTLRDSFDIHRVARALDRTIGALRADGAVVLTACQPDPGRMLGLPSALARPLGRRMRAVNTVVRALSARYETVHVELGDHSWVADRGAWSVDRLHPSELGHRLLAREFHTALTTRGVAMGEPPSLVLDGPAPSPAAAAWWMATRGTRWIADRCTDLLPGLLALAALEWRHRLTRTEHLLDSRDEQAARAALAALDADPGRSDGDSRHPAADPGHAGCDSRHPAADLGRSGRGSRHPGGDPGRSDGDSRHPGADPGHPGCDSRHPDNDSRHPGADPRDPGHSDGDSRRPGADSRHPGEGAAPAPGKALPTPPPAATMVG